MALSVNSALLLRVACVYASPAVEASCDMCAPPWVDPADRALSYAQFCQSTRQETPDPPGCDSRLLLMCVLLVGESSPF